uniref:SDR family NAD(P)-dependent oxidoreductase n=1 Tax=Cephaloticoccus sp. TaxID=1985742 RepID=UPI00404A034F
MASLSEALKPFSAVIVTGGSSGIGKSFIKLLRSLQPDLQFCNLSRSFPELKSGELKLHHIAVDLADRAGLGTTVESIDAWLASVAPVGKVLLINNSGYGGYGAFPEPDITHQLGMIDLNVRALVELSARLLPTLRTRGGAIINIASTAAFQPTPWMAVYGATKVFVLHWSLALNQELRGTGVQVLAVCPGPTATEFFRRAGLKQGSVVDALSMDSETVVQQSLQALATGRSLVVTGWKNKLGAAVISVFPKPLATWISSKVLARFRLQKVAR